MPLTHVCIWDSQIGYQRISLDEACSLYPYSVFVDRGFFIYELCAQNLGLSKARKDTGTRYFFHSSGEQDKTCEARQSSYNNPITSLNEHTMPLRIAVHGSAFTLQIGFFWPRYSKAYCEKIRITGNSRQAYEYTVRRNPDYQRPKMKKRGDSATTQQKADGEFHRPDGSVVTGTTDVTREVEGLLGSVHISASTIRAR